MSYTGHQLYVKELMKSLRDKLSPAALPERMEGPLVLDLPSWRRYICDTMQYPTTVHAWVGSVV